MPYKIINNKLIINVIVKIISKSCKNVVLSNYLNEIHLLKYKLQNNNIYIHNGKILSNYLYCSFIEYICKIRKQEVYTQEIHILINSINNIKEKIIIELAQKCKRVNIVTNNLEHFNKLEKYLEQKLGIAITITNNKRKSLAKASIIINLDYNQEQISAYNINLGAIIFNLNYDINIHLKLFSGINIKDYQITYNHNIFENSNYNKFNKTYLYETEIINLNYNVIIEKIKQDNVKIVNLLGQKGIIDTKEFAK